MLGSFRAAMTWLHTWFGLVLGFVLMVVFFFGTLSVFDREIDRWVVPQTRFAPQPLPSFDHLLAKVFPRITPEEAELEAARDRVGGALPAELPLLNWSAYTTHRDPVLWMGAEFAVTNNPDDPRDHVHGHLTIDPRSGDVLPDSQLKIGSEWFYPMHYSLHLTWQDLGYWLVGLAALSMLVALVSGVVIHRRLFKEIFTFRPLQNLQRSTLDLHNLTGVVALPFHFLFALTGLIIFAGIYFPVSETLLQPLADRQARAQAAAEGLAFDPSGVPAPLASVDAMVLEAKRRWAARGMPGEVGFLTVTHVGDASGYVSIYRAGSDRVTLVGQAVHFESSSGRVLREEPPPSAVMSVNDFLTGLHLQHFEHWLLRWLYVLGGLSGSVCIGTGLVFFVGKRKQRHASQGLSGARWADALAVTSITGMLIAALSMLVANWLLPFDLEGRAEWQKGAFWAAWAAALAHAALRRTARLSPAWREQCWAVAALALGAVALNWVSTGDHLPRTLQQRYWPVAGFDLALLGTATLAVYAALQLRRRERLVPALSPAADEFDAPDSAESAHG